MTLRLVTWCTRHAWLVLAIALAAGGVSELARRELARDVIPDLSSPQIVVVVDWMGHAAPDVAREVTEVVTRALDGVPGAIAVRGSTMEGMAYIDVVFHVAADLARGRRAIAAAIAGARLPPTARVQLGPLASSTGWVFQYALVDPARKRSQLQLRRLQDDVLRPALAALPGVAEVASVGGEHQQLVVEARPAELRARRVAFSDVVATLGAALAPTGDGAAAVPALPALPELPALPALAGLAALAVPPTGAPLGEIARVRITDDMPAGIADLAGVAPAVGGVVIAERGANLPAVLARVRAALTALRAVVPAGVQLVTVYDRLDVADRVSAHLGHALGAEIAIVGVILLLFLLHVRSSLVPLVTLPLVVLLAFAAMWLLDLPATVMSLGGIAIALGMAVDADVVALEACHRWLELAPARDDRALRARLVAAASSFAPAILTSLVIAAISFLPVFAFSGETGRLLRPLAMTKTLIVVASAVVSLTVAPALRAKLLTGPVRRELANPLTRTLIRGYRPVVDFALRRPLLTLITAGLAVASCLPIAGRLGGEFLPRVDEGDLLFMPTTLPGVPAEEAAAILRRQDRALSTVPEIASVFGKVGRADTATDPAPWSMAEITIRLKPRAEWPQRRRARWYSGWAPGPVRRALGLIWPEEGPATTDELIARLDQLTRLPGWTSAWTAPARGRIDMMATGVRTPLGVRIVARDPRRLEALGAAVRARVLGQPGTRSAAFESLGGQAQLRFAADPAALAAAGVSPALAATTAALVLSGGQLGDVIDHGQRLRVRAAADVSERGLADTLRSTTVRGAAGPVPLALLGAAVTENLPSMIRSERGEPCAYVYIDLDDGTDALSYVERARAALAPAALGLLPGERVEWTGQYRLIVEGQRRLAWIIPLVAFTMFGLLMLQFRSATEALIVLAAVPFALVGSVWTLFLLGYPLSAPVWVGLLSVVGLAMQTGVVMVVYIDEAFHRRLRAGKLATRDDIIAAHAEGTVRRLRPKLMTITTMGLALAPLIGAEGAGSEIMRRVAAPMVGGLVTSAFLTLEVLPVLYTIWRTRQLRRAQRLGVALEVVVGPPPPWARDLPAG